GGHQGGQQFELLGDGIELVLDRRHLAVDDAGGAVDQQAFGGTGGAGQHHDVGDARDQRQRGERQSQGRDQRKAEGTARGRRHSTRRRIGTRRYGGVPGYGFGRLGRRQVRASYGALTGEAKGAAIAAPLWIRRRRGWRPA